MSASLTFLRRRRVDLIAGLIAAVVCGAEAYLVMGRSLLSIRHAIDESKSLTAQLADRQEQQRLLAGAQDLNGKLQKTIGEFDRRFQVTQGFDHFYGEVLDRAGQDGLELRNVNASPAQLENGIERIPIHLKLAGSYPQFYEFARKLFGQPYVIKLESLSIVNNDGVGKCEFDLTITLRKLQDGRQAGAP